MRFPIRAASISSVAALLVSLAPVAPSPAPPTVHVFSFALEPSQVVPPITSLGFGWATVTLDDVTRAYTVTGQYRCLNGIANNVHFHGPAGIGSEAGPFVTLSATGGKSGTISGSGTLTVQEVQDMLNGLVYVQLHSSSHLLGELRGQVLPCEAAKAFPNNGTGANPVALTADAPPVLGTDWTLNVDCSGHAPSAAILLFYSRSRSPKPINIGEVLVLLSSKLLARTDLMHMGNTVSVTYVLPSDPSLCGLTAFVQALVLGAPGGQLTNRINLIFGT